ncbi:MAG: dicarboxylate/amino acid:cation symporter [Firmicutes bacterium]|nr:dicarboxylate/amino acid:cation symporter [Bacillota bacterium]
MKKIIKNYKSTIILLVSVIIGTICGLIFKEKTSIVKPLGDLFLNLLLVIIVPLIFFTITSSISKMSNKKRLSKIIINTFIIFLITSVIACLFALLTTSFIDLVSKEDTVLIQETFKNNENVTPKLNILERTVNVLSTNSFINLLSTDNLVALIIMSILLGLAINKAGTKGRKVADFFCSFSEIMYKLIEIIMYYAPIGLGCYFASLVGSIGSTIALGFLKTFIVFTITSILFMFIFYTLYAFIAGRKKGVKLFWKNILPVALTAVGTCSSAASVPINISCTKKIGVPNDIAETTVSLGTSFHKDGSCMGSVFKIMFLVNLFGTSLLTIGDFTKVLGIALLATLLVTAVPIGGGTISEMLILSMLNYNVAALPILTIIATIIDAPATLLNVIGDTASSMLVTKTVEKNNWLEKSQN